MITVSRYRPEGSITTNYTLGVGTPAATFTGADGKAMEGLFVDAMARHGGYRLVDDITGEVLIGTLDEILNPAPGALSSGRASVVSADA